MEAQVSYEELKQHLPKLVENLTEQLLAKINKHKNKDILSKTPETWSWSFYWGQRIQGYSFNDILSGKAQQVKKEPETPEEKVHDLFKAGDIVLSIYAKEARLQVREDFPQYNDKGFYIPKEVVEFYNNDKTEVLDKPTIFLYIDDKLGQRLEEFYVIGGIEDNKTHEKLIILKNSDNISYAYEINHDTNNLNAKTSLSLESYSKIQLSDFDNQKEIKVGKKKYLTLSADDSLALLNGKNEWIQDKDSVLGVLLGQLSQSPGFIAIGYPQKNNKVTIIPKGLKKKELHSPKDPNLKSRFNIK